MRMYKIVNKKIANFDLQKMMVLYMTWKQMN